MINMKNKLVIGGRIIDDVHLPYVIAEAAISHQGEIRIAKRMVYVAHAMGCDAIKFQMHILHNEMLRDVETSSNFDEPLYETLDKTNLSIEEHKELQALCNVLGIDYLCTPFSAKAADILDEMGVVAFKIGSGELTNIPLLKHISSKGRPMIVSTGMSEPYEIKETVDEISKTGVQFALTHCISAYPTPYNRVNLDNIPKYNLEYGVPVGLSDHTLGISVPIAAVARGAAIIEKHFTLDKNLEGPDHAASLDPSELSIMVRSIREVELSLGNKIKYPTAVEKKNLPIVRRSLTAACKIVQGEQFTLKNLTTKRPGTGVSATHYWRFLGTIAGRDYQKDEQIANFNE